MFENCSNNSGLSLQNYRTDLRLSRTMIAGISPAYVDRFACDWHRFSTTDLRIELRTII
jgi:hypothetical protein